MADPTPPLSLVKHLLERFLASGRTLDLRDVPAIAQRYTRALGVGSGAVYLVDIQQHRLVPITGGPGLPITGGLVPDDRRRRPPRSPVPEDRPPEPRGAARLPTARRAARHTDHPPPLLIRDQQVA
ncbi:hypothetical protein [Kitasatospora aureofaciens]|uniref:hypothetical protein n=1 Tax=Kitasatospora aureofaciens TaxID=1894 RepID=UPI0036F47F77